MDAIKYLNEHRRMCHEHECRNCPITTSPENNNETCIHFGHLHPEDAVEIVEKWAMEHPRKTNLDKIREMFSEMIAVSSMGENDNVEMLIFYKDYLDSEYEETESETAEWIKMYPNDGIFPIFRCSKCNRIAAFYSEYCPHCGMKMKRECKEEPKHGD